MVAIIDYGVGNLFSLQSSFKAIGAEAVVTADPDVIHKADRILLPGVGGEEQVAARCAYNEIDMVIMFRGSDTDYGHLPQHNEIMRSCDLNNIPVATNLASAEIMVMALDRGDLDWREIVNPTLKDGKKQ